MIEGVTVFVDKPPEGYKSFKCQASGCKRTARGIFALRHLDHLPRKTRCFCTEHGNERIVKHGDARVAQAVEGHMVRRCVSAYGGRTGWEYAIVLSAGEAGELDECESLPALYDAADRAAER